MINNPITKEDYSVDMRTILAKERTLMSQQRLQLNLIGIGLGLFATGFTLIKIVEADDTVLRMVEIAFILGGAALSTVATMQYYHLAWELKTFEVMEQEYVHAYRSQKANDIFEKAKRNN
jgi:uncharacterized membrane protein YidH (DUF202 family)